MHVGWRCLNEEGEMIESSDAMDEPTIFQASGSVSMDGSAAMLRGTALVHACRPTLPHQVPNPHTLTHALQVGASEVISNRLFKIFDVAVRGLPVGGTTSLQVVIW